MSTFLKPGKACAGPVLLDRPTATDAASRSRSRLPWLASRELWASMAADLHITGRLTGRLTGLRPVHSVKATLGSGSSCFIASMLPMRMVVVGLFGGCCYGHSGDVQDLAVSCLRDGSCAHLLRCSRSLVINTVSAKAFLGQELHWWNFRIYRAFVLHLLRLIKRPGWVMAVQP